MGRVASATGARDRPATAETPNSRRRAPERAENTVGRLGNGAIVGTRQAPGRIPDYIDGDAGVLRRVVRRVHGWLGAGSSGVSGDVLNAHRLEHRFAWTLPQPAPTLAAAGPASQLTKCDGWGESGSGRQPDRRLQPQVIHQRISLRDSPLRFDPERRPRTLQALARNRYCSQQFA